jgi:amidophosphoribosyltransferase
VDFRFGRRRRSFEEIEVAAVVRLRDVLLIERAEAALERALVDLDGFYTFAIGTRDGFAVVRDPIACKPAVIAETDEWVAMSSEYRSIATLPGAEKAKTWEPAPATIYAWEKEKV